ncbi:tRNA-dihydrouridine synthase 3, partial [Ceratobasidium sp. 392]
MLTKLTRITTSTDSKARAWPPGTARIKPEYLIGDPFVAQTTLPDDDALENATNHVPKKRSADAVDPTPTAEEDGDGQEEQDGGAPVQKKQRLPASERKRLAKEKRKEQRGANTARTFARMQDEISLSHGASRGEACIDGENKATDIAFPPLDALSTTEPFIAPHTPTPLLDSLSTLDTGARCPNFKLEDGSAFELVKNEQKFGKVRDEVQELNYPASGLQKQLRKHKYPTPVAVNRASIGTPEAPGVDELEAQKDIPDVPMRASEKKRLRWQGMS